MEKATRFKKARIIALDAGVFVGQVERLILDLNARQVAGLLLAGGERAVDGEDLHSLGEDAVTITSMGRLIDLRESTDLASYLEQEEEVYRKEVFTVAGRKVGFITDVLIDPPSRRIVGFEMFSEFLFPGEVHGVILLDDQVIFGRDLVLVPADIQELVEAAASAASASSSPSSSPPPSSPSPRPSLASRFPAVPASAAPAPEPAPGPELSLQPPPDAFSVDWSTGGQGDEGQEAEDEGTGAAALDGSPTIDFSGVEAPLPQVLRQAPAPVEIVEARPDMQRLFADLSVGLSPGATEPEPEPVIVAEPEPEPEPEPEQEEKRGIRTAAPQPSSPKDKLIRFVLDKVSSRDIYDVDGNLVLSKGEVIDEAVVARAQAAELMPQVFLAASQGLHSRLKRG